MKHPTEKDRVRKVVERAFNQMQFYGINVPDRIKNVEYFTRLILKEIKRAEERGYDRGWGDGYLKKGEV